MTMNTVFFKEYEGIVPNPINGALSEVPSWNGLGSQQPPADAAAYGGSAFVQPKLASLELLAGGNQIKESEDQQTLGKPSTTHFTLFSGDCRSTAETGAKTDLQTMDYQAGHFKLGFGQPMVCAQYPYLEQCYGVYSTYGPQIAGRMMLPLSMASDGGPIFVNAKQYNGIMRRRRSRAKAELENKARKLRKPFLHLSRHLHAKRRPRGNGGRFLNTKTSDISNEKTQMKKTVNYKLDEKHIESHEVSEDGGGIINNSKGNTSATCNSDQVTTDVDHLFSRPITSTLHHPYLQMNHLHPPFQAFQNMAMATAVTYKLKV